MIMLPVMHWLMGDPRHSTHHMYMAAAMTVNIAVALPAAWRHDKSGAVRRDLLRPLVVSSLIAVLVGVLVSNLFPGAYLRIGLAVFLLVYCGFNLLRLVRNKPEHQSSDQRTDIPRLVTSGGATGFIGGLLGLGGGVMLVPLLQLLCRVPLKQSIATSSAVICLSAVAGATLKLSTLSSEGERSQDALTLALILAPTAILGGVLGAALTQALPLRAVRVVITVLVGVAAIRLFRPF